MHRFLIVSDSVQWFVRHVDFSVEDNLEGYMVYKCDAHVGGPFATLDEATACAKAAIGDPSAFQTRKYPGQPDLIREHETKWRGR